jgi:DNA helicase-2/ATP-dependent DNA helicase PcrA
VDYPGNLLLTACPGSGKTRTLIAKLVHELETVRGTPRAICCITYTNTAVEEIEHRALEQLCPGDDQHVAVSTIHSFCLNEIVRPFGWLRPGFRSNRKVLTRDDPNFAEIARHAAGKVNLFNLSARDFEAFESISLNAAGELIGMALQNEAVRRAAPFYWERCRELDYVDFGTIVYEAYELVRDYPMIGRALGAKYAWFLIDEFQDTSELQIEILSLLFGVGRSKFFIVGDLAQSIFGFAGARPELVQPFAELIGARTDLSLSGNYRSSPPIVGNGETLFPRNPEMTSEGKEKECTIVPELVRDRSTFAAVMERFLPALAQDNISYGDATILCREWVPLIALSRQLRDAGIPVVGPGARPYKRSRLFANLAEQLCGAVVDPTPNTVRQLERALFFAIRDCTGISKTGLFLGDGRLAIVRLLKQARVAAASGSAVRFLDEMSAATGEILRELEFLNSVQAGMFYPSAQEMKADIVRQGADLNNLGVVDLGLFASPEKALKLSTVHAAKGREYKGVALIEVTEGKYPHYYSRTAAAIDEDKRLLYVGLTRARRVLMYISAPDRFNNQPSRFLGGGGLGFF